VWRSVLQKQLLLLQNNQIDLSPYGVVAFGYTEEKEPLSFDRFLEWVKKNYHGELGYLEGERASNRKTVSTVFPQFQSALVFLFTYIESKAVAKNRTLAGFVRGFNDLDYHHVVKHRLNEIGKLIGQEYMVICDTHPVLERDLAYRAGLGWFGKNSMLINKDHGSYTIIGSLLFSLSLGLKSEPFADNFCGECSACISSCPTNAILGNGMIDANLCISKLTIEGQGSGDVPAGYEASSWIFGCDACLDCCPWNKKAIANVGDSCDELVDRRCQESSVLIDTIEDDDPEKVLEFLEGLSSREFRKKFKSTSFERSGREKLIKNFKLKTR